MISRRLVAVLSVLGLVACGGRSDDGDGTSAPCVAGAQVRCPCANGASGVQVCRDDGAGFDACSCESDSEPGNSGAGGTGASGGGAASGSAAGGRGGAATRQGLPYEVVDAEYSRELDRIVLLTKPAELHLFDAFSREDLALTLPTEGSAVSVSPSGKQAAVGHDGWVTLVDLVELKVDKTLHVSCDTADIVLASNEYAYVFPATDQWEEIRSLNLRTGLEEEYRGDPIYAGTLAKQQPGSLAIYGASNGLSPSDIEKYDISAGAASYLYDSVYHGDYDLCGDLWFAEDGARIFTRCGNVFSASAEQATDMKYQGSLDLEGDPSPGGLISHVTHSGKTGKVVAIIGERTPSFGAKPVGGHSIRVYEDRFLKTQQTIDVGSISGRFTPKQCRYVFVDNAGFTLTAICSNLDETRPRGEKPATVIDFDVFNMSL